MWLDEEKVDERSAPNDAADDAPKTGSNEQSDGKPSDKDKDKDKDSSKALELRLRQLEQELAQARESERYWAEIAKKAASGRMKADEEPDDGGPRDAEEPVDAFIDELSTQGLKALRKRGFLTADEARRMIEEAVARERARMMSDAELIRKYPELTDESSPVFQRAKELYRELIKREPALENSPVALDIAARLAKAEVGHSQPENNNAAAAVFDRAGRRRAPGSDDGRLSDQQRMIIEKFNRDGGVKVTEEAYRNRARAGVNMAVRAMYSPGSVSWED